MKRKKMTWGKLAIYVILGLFAATIVVAFLHLFSISFSPSHIATKGGLHLWPKEFTLRNYEEVFGNYYIWMGYKNTLIRTVIGVVLGLIFTSMAAYALSKPYFPHRDFWTLFVVFTMFFSGGLIPNFLLVKNLGLMDTYGSMILPGLITTYNLIVMRNYFQSLPEELEESAFIDGAGRMTIFLRIILPLSKPILATVALWIAVGHWNAWYDAMLYIQDPELMPLQTVLRRVILTGATEILALDSMASVEIEAVSSEGVKAACIYVATIPIMCVYPFLQKHFVKGIMMGSLKG